MATGASIAKRPKVPKGHEASDAQGLLGACGIFWTGLKTDKEPRDTRT